MGKKVSDTTFLVVQSHYFLSKMPQEINRIVFLIFPSWKELYSVASFISFSRCYRVIFGGTRHLHLSVFFVVFWGLTVLYEGRCLMNIRSLTSPSKVHTKNVYHKWTWPNLPSEKSLSRPKFN